MKYIIIVIVFIITISETLIGQAFPSKFPQNPTTGDMVYYNGTKWVSIAPGQHGQTLSFCDGVPTWGPCLDIQPPTQPVNLLASGGFSSGTILSWTSSTDNNDVTGYDIYIDNVLNGSTIDTSYEISGLMPNTSYVITVRAKDMAGNVSSTAMINYYHNDTTPNDSLDVVFVMDASGSVGQNNWLVEKDFVQNFIATGINDLGGRSRVGLIVFSSTVEVGLHLSDEQTMSNISNAIDNLPYLEGHTHTNEAMNEAINLFNNESDPGRKKLIILITDGNPRGRNGIQDACDTRTLDFLSKINNDVIVIGVGQDWAPAQISCLVDDPNSKIISLPEFSAESFNSLILNNRLMNISFH